MNLYEIMKEKDIRLECLFTLSKLNDQEGLMFFEPITDIVNDVEVTNLKPQCFIIDDGKFVYDEEMDSKIIVNAIDNVITFTRIDGVQLNIDTTQINGFPFKTTQFKNKLFVTEKPEVPKDYVKIED